MLTAWSVTLLMGSALAAPAPPAPVPREIAEHYRDYNFVNAFSTSRERQTIGDDRQPPTEGRLGRVAKILARLAAAVDEVDAGILPQMGRPRHESEFRSDLVRVSSCRVDEEKGEAWVHLEVTALDEAVVGTLVAQYDHLTRQGRKVPEPDDLMAVAPRGIRGTVTREVHRWFRVDGVWRRDAAAYLMGL